MVNKSNALHFEYFDQSFEKNWEVGAKGGKNGMKKKNLNPHLYRTKSINNIYNF